MVCLLICAEVAGLALVLTLRACLAQGGTGGGAVGILSNLRQYLWWDCILLNARVLLRSWWYAGLTVGMLCDVQDPHHTECLQVSLRTRAHLAMHICRAMYEQRSVTLLSHMQAH
jgi:hypothetical protein